MSTAVNQVHTETIIWAGIDGHRRRVMDADGKPERFFASAPNIEAVRELLLSTLPADRPFPILLITRQIAKAK